MSAVALCKDRKKRAFTYINTRIEEGVFEPGARLDVNVLAKTIRTSSTPVREALSALESIGVVELLPRFGPVVRKMTPEQVGHLYELRESLECFAAEKAAERRTDAHLAELRRHCDIMRAMLKRRPRNREAQSMEDTGWVAADFAFHHTLLEASGNGELIRMAKQCQLLTKICRIGIRAAMSERELWNGRFLTWWTHARIYRAVQRRLPEEAGRRLRSHLRGAKELTVFAIQQQMFMESPREDLARVRDMETL